MNDRIFKLIFVALMVIGTFLFLSSAHVIAPPDSPEDLRKPRPPQPTSSWVMLFAGSGCIMTGAIMAYRKKR